MKKIMAFFLAFFLAFSAPAVFAQMPLGVPVAPAVAPAFERIGVVAAAQGKVELKMPGQVGRVAASGQPVFMKDEVTTDAVGHLQILLLDETVFTIGPSSAITIDEFVYDPKSHDGEIRASITKGLFRYVSGKIAAKRPDRVSVKLPTSTIGFRGTIVGGSVADSGQGIVALLGPGDNNDAGAQNGSFTIEGQGGEHQDVNRTGFGVEVGSDGGISGVFQLSNEQVNGLTNGLAPDGGNGQGGGAGGQGGGSDDQGGGAGGGLFGSNNMDSLSGEAGVLTSQNSSLTGALTNFTDGLNDVSNQEAQDALDQNVPSEPSSIANTKTTFTQLATIETGAYHYYGSGTFTEYTGGDSRYPVTGSFTASWDINFATEKIENVGVDISIKGGHVTAGFDLNSFAAFGSGSDPAVFDLPKTPNSAIPLTAVVSLLNDSNGKIAGQGDIVVGYSASYTASHSGATGSGSFSTIATTIADGVTTIEQLTRVVTGLYQYNVTGGVFKDSEGAVVGTLTGKCLIDFGNKTIGGGNSYLTITSGSNIVTTNGVGDGKNYSGMPGNAVFQWTNTDAMKTGNPYPVGRFDTIDVTLNNSNGIIAQEANVSVKYTDGGAGGSSGIPNGTGTGTGTLAWSPAA